MCITTIYLYVYVCTLCQGHVITKNKIKQVLNMGEKTQDNSKRLLITFQRMFIFTHFKFSFLNFSVGNNYSTLQLHFVVTGNGVLPKEAHILSNEYYLHLPVKVDCYCFLFTRQEVRISGSQFKLQRVVAIVVCFIDIKRYHSGTLGKF